MKRFEPPVREEPATALDGVHGAEHPGQRLGIAGRRLERDQVHLHRIEMLVALGEELLLDVFHPRGLGCYRTKTPASSSTGSRSEISCAIAP